MEKTIVEDETDGYEQRDINNVGFS